MTANSFNGVIGSYLSVSDLYVGGFPVATSNMSFDQPEAYWLATTSAYSDLLGADVVANQ